MSSEYYSFMCQEGELIKKNSMVMKEHRLKKYGVNIYLRFYILIYGPYQIQLLNLAFNILYCVFLEYSITFYY